MDVSATRYKMLRLRVWTRFVLLSLKVMLMRVRLGMVEFVNWIAWATMQLMRRLTLVAGGLISRLLMLAATFLESVVANRTIRLHYWRSHSPSSRTHCSPSRGAACYAILDG